MKLMHELDLSGKRVLIREDLNVPIKDGKVTSDARLLATLPTIRQALTSGAAIILMSHLGRPEEGTWEDRFSLAPVAHRLSELLEVEVKLVTDWESAVPQQGQILLLENVRFNSGEKQNSDALGQRYAISSSWTPSAPPTGLKLPLMALLDLPPRPVRDHCLQQSCRR
jgi:phosphoglycerate kinase